MNATFGDYMLSPGNSCANNKNAVCTYKPLRKVKESYQQKNPHSKIISKLLKKVDRVTALFLDQQKRLEDERF